MKPNVILSRHGELKSDYFYEVFVDANTSSLARNAARRKGSVLCGYPGTDPAVLFYYPYLRAELAETGGWHLEYQCSLNKAHVTRTSWSKIIVSLDEGPEVAPLTCLHQNGADSVVLPADFATKLRESPFTGYTLEAVTFDAASQKRIAPTLSKNLLPLYLLQFAGRKIHRPVSIVGHPNRCPWCGESEIVCQECGSQPSLCPNCEKGPWINERSHKGPGDRRLIVDRIFDKPPILEGCKWDGHDFLFYDLDTGMRGNIVTARVVQWLQKEKAYPFLARPAEVCIDGMTAKQLKRLEEVKSL